MGKVRHVRIRRLLHVDELDAASRFEGEIWGASDPTPRPLLLVFAHHGGIVLGAYHQNDLVGLSLGFPAIDQNGHTYLHSHLLGVRPQFRGGGIGTSLKQAQRDYAKSQRLSYIGWTYDPLLAANAWFNLGVLGARVDALQANAYGRLDDQINGALPTHRFWVTWSTEGLSSLVSTEESTRMMPIPPDVGELRQKNPKAASEQADTWFAEARRWWEQGWRVQGVRRSGGVVCYDWIKQEGKRS